MAFALEVKLTGLCHFIENADPTAKVRLCAVLPNIKDHPEFDRCHEPRILLGADLSVVRPLCGECVTFEFEYELGEEPIDPTVTGAFERTVRMVEMLGSLADSNPAIVSEAPGSLVGAQILFDRGALSEEGEGGTWNIPIDLGSEMVRRTLPQNVLIREEGLKSVKVRIRKLDGSAEETLTLRPYPMSVLQDTIAIVITADCEVGAASGSGRAVKLGRDLKRPLRDEDFAAHYLLLEDDTRGRIQEILAQRLPGDTGKAKRKRQKKEIPADALPVPIQIPSASPEPGRGKEGPKAKADSDPAETDDTIDLTVNGTAIQVSKDDIEATLTGLAKLLRGFGLDAAAGGLAVGPEDFERLKITLQKNDLGDLFKEIYRGHVWGHPWFPRDPRSPLLGGTAYDSPLASDCMVCKGRTRAFKLDFWLDADWDVQLRELTGGVKE